MTPLLPPPDDSTKSPPTVIAKLLVGALSLALIAVMVNTALADSDQPDAPVSAQSLFTAASADIAIATTAPVEIPTPTATVVPTATAVPTTAPAPTVTAIPTATSVPVAPDPAPVQAPAVSAEAVEAAPVDAAASDPAPAPEPAIADPTAEPTAEPTATPEVVVEPTATPEVVVEEPTPEPTPTLEPTPTPTPGMSIADMESYVLGEVNQVRANAGLGPLTLDFAISNIARDWSMQMATGGFFSHRPGDQLDVMMPAGWQRWGENIASAPSIAFAQDSLEASQGHYENMVGDYTHIGIGVYITGTQVWVTQNFGKY